MTEYASDLYPYSLEKAIKADCGEHDRDCFVVDVGHNEFGVQVDSLQHLINVVECHQSNTEELRPIRKLYIIGAWRLTPSKEECEGFGEETKRHEGEPHLFTKQEEEWHEAGKNIAKFVALMPKLEELTWISSLPFTAWVWEGLSLSMTKIIIDIGFPVRLQVNGFDDIYKSYITCKELKPLIQQTKLEELRLFHMQDSYQNIIWETVYRNTNEDGMRLLDLTMAEPPLVRPKHWQKANDVAGLTVAIAEACGKEYKGIEGQGVLYHSFGTGEYLDHFCMRKARITAKLDHTKPLPLQYLKLNGFVIDHLPFEEELTSLELLICGEMCIDAGVRVPETRQAPHNRWSGVVNNTLTHCMIMWPNWNGIFDASGHQCDESGDVGPAGEMDSTPVAEPLSAAEIPLPETEDEGLEDDYLGTVGHMAASMEDSESDDSDDSIYYSATEVIAGE